MRFTAPLRVASAVLWLPDGRDEAGQAVAQGRLDPKTADRLGYTEVTESEISAPEMAAIALEGSLSEADWDAGSLPLLAHAWTYHQGHDFWSPAHYVAHKVGALGAQAVGLQQMCTGGVAALSMAASRLIADDKVDRCAVTTADRFAEPGFDRWCGDYDLAYGDGATAILLQPHGGRFELLSVAIVSAPQFETMHRGDDEFSPAVGWHSDAIDVRRTKRAFIESGAAPRFVEFQRDAISQVLAEALSDTGLDPEDTRLRYVTLPRIGTEVLADSYEPAIRDTGVRHAVLLDLGRDTGHLGAGDAAADLAQLASMGDGEALGPGEVALLLSVGGGYTWSCIAVRAT